jgi:DNA polymerase-1
MEEIIFSLDEKTDKCQKCNLWRSSSVSNGLYSANKIMGEGNLNAPIVFLDSYPKEEEIKQKRAFVGVEGQILKKYCQTVGIDNYFCTYLHRCRPNIGELPTGVHTSACSPYLVEEINKIKPKVIVVLGGASAPFFGLSDKITQIRGIPVWNEQFNCYILPTYSCSYLNNFVDASHQRREFCEDLSKALKIVNGNGMEEKMEVNYKYASSIAEVEWMTKQLLQVDWFSADTEFTSLDYFRAKLLLNSFSLQEGTGFVIPYLHPQGFNEQGQKEVFPYLKQIWESGIKKVFQFGKIDVQVLKTHGIDVHKFAFDTGLAHALLDENSPHGLDKIVPIYTDMGNYKDETSQYIEGKVKILNEGIIKEGTNYWEELGSLNEIKDKVVLEALKKKSTTYKKVGEIIRRKVYMDRAFRKSTILDCPYDQLLKYSAQDADATFRLKDIFWSLLEKENLLKLLIKVQVPNSYVLAQMEYEGIGGDLDYAKKISTKIGNEINLAEANILASREVAKFLEKYKVKDNKFNINSSDQVGNLLFDIIGLKPIKYNKVTATQKEKGIKKGTPSVDTPSLELMFKDNKIKILEDLIKIGKIYKSKEYMDSYIDILSNSVDGRIHTTYNQARTDQGGTIAGRLSSKNPNLQNVTSHDPVKAKLIRTVFVARPGYTFIEADYKAIEFTTWAHASQDEKMLNFIKEGKDIHKMVAAQSRKISEDQVTKQIRDIAKMTVYGMVYGRSTYSIAKEYNMEDWEVQSFVNGFFNLFPKATQYIENNVLLMEKQGYITNIFGRRRRALDIYSKNKQLKEAAQRQARNFPLQSAAADLIFIAMIKLYKALLPYPAKMILQIHDSLVIEIRDDYLGVVIPLVKETMENAVKLLCPPRVDIEIGKTLGDMQEYKFN